MKPSVSVACDRPDVIEAQNNMGFEVTSILKGDGSVTKTSTGDLAHLSRELVRMARNTLGNETSSRAGGATVEYDTDANGEIQGAIVTFPYVK